VSLLTNIAAYMYKVHFIETPSYL